MRGKGSPTAAGQSKDPYARHPGGGPNARVVNSLAARIGALIETKPRFGLAVGVTAVSFSAIFVKLAAAPAVIAGGYRLALTVLILVPALWNARSELRAYDRSDLLRTAASGVLLGLHFALWFASLTLTSVAASVVLVTTQPLWVLIGESLFYGRRFRPREVWGSLVALSGAVLIGWGDLGSGGAPLLGDLLALVAAWLVSGYFLIGRSVRRRRSALSYSTLCYAVGAAVLLLGAAPLLGTPLGGYSAHSWAYFLALAVIPTLAGHTLFNALIARLPASSVAVSVLGEPIGATLLAFLILEEVPTWNSLIGGLVILTGIVLFFGLRRKPESLTG